MNIAGVNSSPLLSGTSPSVGLPIPLLVNSAVPEGFTGTLVEQIALLSAAINQNKLPLQIQNIVQSKVTESVNGNVSLLENKSTLQELAALLGKELPVSYKINEDVKPEAIQAALTDLLKYMTTGSASEKVNTDQNSADQNVDEAKMNVPAQVSPNQVFSGLMTESVENKPEKQTEDTQIENQPDNTRSIDGESPEIISQLLMPPALPEGKITEKKIDDSSANEDVITENAVLSFLTPVVTDNKLNLQPSVTNNKLNSLKEDTPLDIFLPKAAAFKAPVQDKQQSLDLNLNSLEKTVLIEQPSSSLSADKAAPQQIPDIVQLDKPLSTKTDVPAITKPLTHPDWSKDMGDRIIWMNNKAIPAAEIRLNPQHLGPISVRIDINQDQATITFSAQHSAAREALEASIPKLREMMSAQQLNLVDVNISQQSTPDHGRSSSQGFAQTAGGSGNEQGNKSMATEGVTNVIEDIENGQAIVSKGLLSLYA
ncbi:MAG: flagellar hook-length control protein FliK [Methylobacter sp.]|nr:flagellar hook-length control protein FliK [Methylobacter sp.]